MNTSLRTLVSVIGLALAFVRDRTNRHPEY